MGQRIAPFLSNWLTGNVKRVVSKSSSSTSSVASWAGPIFDTFLGDSPIYISFWDGSSTGPEDAKARVNIKSIDALRRIIWAPGELGLSRAYIMGDIEFDGDGYETMRVLSGIEPVPGQIGLRSLLKAANGVRSAGALGRPLPVPAEETVPRGIRHSIGRDSKSISHHYDVGNEFYKLFLGSTMTYSCARFINHDDSLDQAQTQKYDLVCRKLGLKPGMRLLDVGCGWGGMVMHAAQNYGVTAVGITVSKQQAELARKRVDDAGLSGNIEIRLQDYRELGNEVFDAISSIGMFEHVGRVRVGEYFSSLYNVLKPEGRLLNHAIDSVGGSVMDPNGFIARYVFPDGELQDIADTAGAIQDAGFEVRDIESLREHYAKTLRFWVAALEMNRKKAEELVGVARTRVWWLYMAGSAVAFENNRIGIHQTIAVKTGPHGESGMPLTRAEFV
jgi:cyclopropane-fatty-acyl-phospholipid synthase